MKKWMSGILSMILGGSVSARAMGGASWKEEVLMHDSNKLIVKRSQSYGDRREIAAIFRAGHRARPQDKKGSQ